MVERITDETLQRMAQEIGTAARRLGVKLTTAESCTAGLIASTLTTMPGSSAWFERGFVTYSNLAKQEMLAVPAEVIAREGAVSQAAAAAMAQGALAYSHADVSVAVTGTAGPDGGTPDKPVGTVWFAWASRTGIDHTAQRHFAGDRDAVRRQSVAVALEGLQELINQLATER